MQARHDMKLLALGLTLVAALVLGWLAWNSRRSEALPSKTRVPETHAAARAAATESVAPAPESSPAALQAPGRSQPLAAAPDSTTVDPVQILVHVRVADEQGEPVPGFGVQWIDNDGSRRDSSGEAGSSVTPGLHPGHYLAVVWGVDLRREEHEVEIAPRPESQAFDFVAHAQPPIVVRILGVDGAPLLVFEGKRPPGPPLASSSLFPAKVPATFSRVTGGVERGNSKLFSD